MYKVHCRTNLDSFKSKRWPTELNYRPLIGERIEAKQGGWNLKIVAITHRCNGTLLIELHR